MKRNNFLSMLGSGYAVGAGAKSNTNGGTRTLNLSLRRGAPYPLGHVGKTVYPAPF